MTLTILADGGLSRLASLVCPSVTAASTERAVVEPPVLPGRLARRLANTFTSAPSSDVGELVVVVVVVVSRPAPGLLPLMRPANPLAAVVVDDGGAVDDVTSATTSADAPVVVEEESVTLAAVVEVVVVLPAPGRLPPKRLDKPAVEVSPAAAAAGLAVVVVRPAPGLLPPKSPAKPPLLPLLLAVVVVGSTVDEEGVRTVVVLTAGLRAMSPARALPTAVVVKVASVDVTSCELLPLVLVRLPPNELAVSDDDEDVSSVAAVVTAIVVVSSSISSAET